MLADVAEGQRRRLDERPRLDYSRLVAEVRIARDQHRSRAKLAEIRDRIQGQIEQLEIEHGQTGSEAVKAMLNEARDVIQMADDADHLLRDPVAEGHARADRELQERLRQMDEAKRQAAAQAAAPLSPRARAWAALPPVEQACQIIADRAGVGSRRGEIARELADVLKQLRGGARLPAPSGWEP
jgi:uncharacterized protein (DUF885 family)